MINTGEFSLFRINRIIPEDAFRRLARFFKKTAYFFKRRRMFLMSSFGAEPNIFL